MDYLPDSIKQKVEELNDPFYNDKKFNEMLKIVENRKETEAISYKIRALWKLRRNEEAIALKGILSETNDQELKNIIKYNLIRALINDSREKEALEMIESLKKAPKSKLESVELVYICERLLYTKFNHIDLVISTILKHIDFVKKTYQGKERDEKLRLFYNQLGIHYANVGKYISSEKCFRNTVEIAEKYQENQVLHYNNLGQILLSNNNNSEGIEYLEKAIELSNNKGLRSYDSEINLMTFNHDTNREVDIEKVIQLLSDIENDTELKKFVQERLQVEVIELIVKILNRNERQKGMEYIERLNQIQMVTPYYSPNYNLLLAQYHYHGRRAKDKLKAQDLFSEILANKSINFEIFIQAAYNQLDLLIDEYKQYGEAEVRKEIYQIMGDIEKKSLEGNKIKANLRFLIVKAHLEEIEGDFKAVQLLYDKAEELIQNNEINFMLDEVITLRNEFNTRIETQYNQINQNKSIFTRVEESKIKNYLKKALEQTSY
ncbi:MAG: tetratricopeptide repeat protein [Candidatus Heimdallarchaeota archaeon]|nr:tetratricopeptide repeat protein [Candidatus Heimdallarchaeota archaeon]